MYSQYSNRHRSNAEELINRFPVIEVDGPIAVCDGGNVFTNSSFVAPKLRIAKYTTSMCPT